jgi:ATP-dependent DNA helicase RecQ
LDSLYLGDTRRYACKTCSNCQSSNFPVVRYPQRIYTAARRFLEEDYLPRIEKHATARQQEHEAGWSLSYHGGTQTGKLVRASKYEDAGPFSSALLMRAVAVIRARYPLDEIDAIVSVPPTRSGMLVEAFACALAEQLGLAYAPLIVKVRETKEQKTFTN